MHKTMQPNLAKGQRRKQQILKPPLIFWQLVRIYSLNMATLDLFFPPNVATLYLLYLLFFLNRLQNFAPKKKNHTLAHHEDEWCVNGKYFSLYSYSIINHGGQLCTNHPHASTQQPTKCLTHLCAYIVTTYIPYLLTILIQKHKDLVNNFIMYGEDMLKGIFFVELHKQWELFISLAHFTALKSSCLFILSFFQLKNFICFQSIYEGRLFCFVLQS